MRTREKENQMGHSRVLKFRAWNKRQKKMYFFDLSKAYSFVGNVHIEQIMQYTGLHDKNGKEVYEGDIVKYDPFGKIGFFQYIENGFWILEEEQTRFLPRYCQVIGNVYQNPDLLK